MERDTKRELIKVIEESESDEEIYQYLLGVILYVLDHPDQFK